MNIPGERGGSERLDNLTFAINAQNETELKRAPRIASRNKMVGVETNILKTKFIINEDTCVH